MRLQLEKRLLFLSLLCILSKVREMGLWGSFSLTRGSTWFLQNKKQGVLGCHNEPGANAGWQPGCIDAVPWGHSYAWERHLQ